VSAKKSQVVSKKEPQTMEIIFSRAEGYRLVPATGAWGGVSPQGEIIVDLYVEQRQNPERMEVEVRKGELIEEKRYPHPQPIIRESQVGIVLRPDIAKTIGEFLIKFADLALDVGKSKS
jgi:hypothetical protein